MFEHIFADAPEGLLVEVAYGDPPVKREWFNPSSHISRSTWPAGHCFYSVALRTRQGSKKDDTGPTHVLWVDRDQPDFRRATFPPTFVVWSGHGWHYYWLLSEWTDDHDAIERCNKILIEDVDGDKACWNVNRLLRVPETDNNGVPCELRSSSPEITYNLDDVLVLEHLDKKIRHKIKTGDKRGYKSRSERDWAVVTALLSAGAEERLVETLFRHQPVGDKVTAPETHSTYLPRTVAKARKSHRVFAGSRTGIEERSDGYYKHRGKTVQRISTFTFEPELLLDGRHFKAEDALVGTLQTERTTWPDVQFTRRAFQSTRMMDRETPYMGWQWLGRDDDVRNLLPYLMDKLKEKGLPRTAATGVLGLHRHGDRLLFVGSVRTLSAEQSWEGVDAPLVYLDTRREHPDLPLEPGGDLDSLKDSLKGVLPALNEPEVVWPILGWYAATPFKPVLEDLGYRFPILNVHGTKGSGKTTTVQRVMMPLFGQREAKSYDANTTRFVVLSVLGSSNAVPVAFSEFRFGAADKFLRYVLLSYDTGHDPRGRADQTTVDYPLSAPFSVDGEDLIADPAAKERILAVLMHPATIDEGSKAYDALRRFNDLDLSGFGRTYIQNCLQGILSGDVEEEVRRSRSDVLAAFPQRLPDRVRNNITVSYLGATRVARFLGMEPPGAELWRRALRGVFDPDLGRAPVAADFMVEDLVNAVNRNREGFTWDYDHSTHTLWFQLSSTYSWYRRGNPRSLGRDAIRVQLKEAPYMTGPETRTDKKVWMFGVSLPKANKLGLDIPAKMNPGVLEVKFEGSSSN